MYDIFCLRRRLGTLDDIFCLQTSLGPWISRFLHDEQKRFPVFLITNTVTEDTKQDSQTTDKRQVGCD